MCELEFINNEIEVLNELIIVVYYKVHLAILFKYIIDNLRFHVFK